VERKERGEERKRKRREGEGRKEEKERASDLGEGCLLALRGDGRPF